MVGPYEAIVLFVADVQHLIWTAHSSRIQATEQWTKRQSKSRMFAYDLISVVQPPESVSIPARQLDKRWWEKKGLILVKEN